MRRPIGAGVKATIFHTEAGVIMAKTWRIAAVGMNGNRVVLDRNLSQERAEELRRMLTACNVFRAVYIELDDELDCAT